MSRQVFAAEVNYQDAPSYVRTKLSREEAMVKSDLQKLHYIFDEVFILSTSNRFTIYVVGEDMSALKTFFTQDISRDYVQFYYNTDEAVMHLFATASGLLSQIKGEHQIINQIRQSHRWALEHGTIGIMLDSLLREAIKVGKAVRTETGIDMFCSSIVDAAMDLVYSKLDNLYARKFLVIGTGKIAGLALRNLQREGIQDLVVAGADVKSANLMAAKFNAEAVSVQHMLPYFSKADVVIGGTHHQIILNNECSNTLIDTNKRQFILDFGSPRNFDDRFVNNPHIELYNLDDLKRMYQSPLNALGGLEEAWSLVMKRSKDFMIVLNEMGSAPILAIHWNRLLNEKEWNAEWLLSELGEDLETSDSSFKDYGPKDILPKNTAHYLKALSNNNQTENASSLVRYFLPSRRIKISASLN